MKQLCLFIFAGLYVCFSSCEKDDFKQSPITSLMIVNAVPGGNSVKLGSQPTVLANNAGAYFGISPNDPNIYIWPVNDSLHPYYTLDKAHPFENRDIYSLYLTGSSTSVESVLVKDDIPYYTDSVAGIRFVNLSPNSPLLNITLSRTPSKNEVSNLSYKQVSDFIAYPALIASPLDTFQFRNASTGVILMTIPFNTTTNIKPRFANATLVIRGVIGSLGFTRVNNDR